MGSAKDLWNEVEALLNKQDLEGPASMFTSDGVYIGPSMRYEGPEAIRAYYREVAKMLSDMNMETSLLIEDGDTVVVEWTSRATNTGPLTMPDGTEIPPTGKRVEGAGVTICKVRDGKFASMREYYDTAEMARQLGLMPG